MGGRHSLFGQLEDGLQKIGTKNGKTTFASVEVAVSIGSYMESHTGTSGKRIAGFKTSDKAHMAPLGGGFSTNYKKAFQDMVNLPVKEFVLQSEKYAASTMISVLKHAVELAPFWFLVDEKTYKKATIFSSTAYVQYTPRPADEGPHLRETGKAWIGSVGSKGRQLVGDITGFAGEYPVASDVKAYPINFFKGKKYRAKTNFYVEFFRLSPKGWDVAMWTHENLAINFHIGQAKYLETAFRNVDPKGCMVQGLKQALAVNPNYSKLKSNQKTALKNAVNKAVIPKR